MLEGVLYQQYKGDMYKLHVNCQQIANIPLYGFMQTAHVVALYC
jgi:hypothetical protein